jgi:hypothetical protein
MLFGLLFGTSDCLSNRRKMKESAIQPLNGTGNEEYGVIWKKAQKSSNMGGDLQMSALKFSCRCPCLLLILNFTEAAWYHSRNLN